MENVYLIDIVCQALIQILLQKWYDFYLFDFNLLIEIDGTYWHGKNLKYNELNKQQIITRNNDVIKNDLAKYKNYNLLRIWSDEIKNFNVKKIYAYEK